MKIFVTFQIAGFHNWPGAPKEFGYLANQHRHVFHFRVEIKVGHNERDVEMIHFKNVARIAVIDRYPIHEDHEHLDFGGSSCETIATNLDHDLTSAEFNVTQIIVSEDGENGAILDRHV